MNPPLNIPACVSVRHTPDNEVRVTLRLTRIGELRPDFDYSKRIAKAESLACHISKGHGAPRDPANWRLEVEAIAEDLSKITELSDELVHLDGESNV